VPNRKFDLKKQPLQERAKFTVDVIKQAGIHILREQGYAGVTTNKVAEKAGVSIGSLYQYFPSKEVLVAEIKRDHFCQLRQLFQQAYDDTAGQALPERAKAFVMASIDAHRLDPVLHSVLNTDLPDFEVKEDDDSAVSVRKWIEKLLDDHRHEIRDGVSIAVAARLSYSLVEAILHDAVSHAPESLEDASFVDEVVLMLLAYLKPAPTG
jgi:AcrR family transcriptional regulator